MQHAVSLVVSAKRKVLHQSRSDRAAEPVQIDPSSVLETVAKFEANYQAERDLMGQVPHLPLVYEDHLADGSQHQTTSNLVFDYLGLEPESAEAKLRKIMPVDLSQGILNYEEVIAEIDRSDYAHLLKEPG